MLLPIPDDEDARLEALRRMLVLDTPPEPQLELLVEYAARHFGSPIGLLSLVDRDRQWLKARVGMEVRETPRDVSFCAPAIAANDDIFVVENAPLTAPEGRRVGLYCVIDHRARRQEAQQDRQGLQRSGRTTSARLSTAAVDNLVGNLGSTAPSP